LIALIPTPKTFTRTSGEIVGLAVGIELKPKNNKRNRYFNDELRVKSALASESGMIGRLAFTSVNFLREAR